jgi:hypothetical protein
MANRQSDPQSCLNDSVLVTDVRAAQVAELYRHGMPGIFGALIGSIILTVGLWPSVPQERLLWWLGAFLLSLVPRIAIGIRFLRTKPTGEAAEPWARMFAVGTFTGGLFWAAVPILLFPDENFLRQALVTFVLGGLSGGIIVANAARRASQIPFVLIVSSAVVGRFFYEGGGDYVSMAVLWLAFTAYLLVAAHRMNMTITESLTLRYENKRNLKALVSRNSEIEELNNSLQEKIEALERAEEELSTSKMGLERRVLDRTQDLVTSNEKLKAVKSLSDKRLRRPYEQARSNIASTLKMSGKSFFPSTVNWRSST